MISDFVYIVDHQFLNFMFTIENLYQDCNNMDISYKKYQPRDFNSHSKLSFLSYLHSGRRNNHLIYICIRTIDCTYHKTTHISNITNLVFAR